MGHVEFKVDLYVYVYYIYSHFHQYPSDNQS